MKTFKHFGLLFGVLAIWSLAFASGNAVETTGEKKILDGEEGDVICTGAGNRQPIFTKDCKNLNLARIWSNGGIKYEGTCLDSNGVTFYLACDAFNFEYHRKLPVDQKASWLKGQ